MTPNNQLAGLRAALRLVQRDLDSHPGDGPAIGTDDDGTGGLDLDGDGSGEATGLAVAGSSRFRLVGTEQGFFVALPDGRFWPAGAGPLPLGAEGDEAVLAVALGVQECFAEILWHAWPRCPRHGAALRAEARTPADEVIWRCGADEGHDVAPVGHLAIAAPRPSATPRQAFAGSSPAQPGPETDN
ncbi:MULTISPECIES: hypothetical protein [unclassified Pseudofrankia]|uniref:hypothetical protein n=1 Tax=unclassified Pseudofrankia TaxID=2994372 RepID=UPI0008DAEE7A|nr:MULTISPECIES: hypothetical protein [unclassified Pseudofrankia]MDT3443796.1 hypothetical protein [Pseudofrankia sp. BMG5.37]OHV49993.1 hypothetical protein BCD48_11680 [Pseudofrankia sp. BMG5.36]